METVADLSRALLLTKFYWSDTNRFVADLSDFVATISTCRHMSRWVESPKLFRDVPVLWFASATFSEISPRTSFGESRRSEIRAVVDGALRHRR